MKYFFVSFCYNGTNHGNVTFSCDGYPSNSSVKTSIGVKFGLNETKIAVTGVQEWSQEQYEAWVKQ